VLVLFAATARYVFSKYRLGELIFKIPASHRPLINLQQNIGRAGEIPAIWQPYLGTMPQVSPWVRPWWWYDNWYCTVVLYPALHL